MQRGMKTPRNSERLDWLRKLFSHYGRHDCPFLARRSIERERESTLGSLGCGPSIF